MASSENNKGAMFGIRELSFVEQISSGIRDKTLQRETHLALLERGRGSHPISCMSRCQDAVKAGMLPVISFALQLWFEKPYGSFT